MKILIAGDTGLLGQAMVRRLAPDHDVAGFSTSPAPGRGYARHTINALLEPDRVRGMVRIFSPDLLINCTGIVDLKACEEGKNSSREINAELPGFFSQLSLAQKSRFIHISTDQVFDGKSKTPYSESSPVNPVNQYGRSKLAGEQAALKDNPDALVLRTNIVGWRWKPGAPTFAEWLCTSLAAGKDISLAEDFVTSSVHVDYFSGMVLDFFKSGARGIYHAASRDGVSKYEFGRLIAAAAGFDFSRVSKVKLDELELNPARPPYLALNVQHAEKLLGHKFPACRDTAKLLAEQFSNEAKEAHENKK